MKKPGKPKTTPAPTPPLPAIVAPSSLSKRYRLAFDVVGGRYLGCAIHVELVARGQPGLAVAIDPQIPVVIEVVDAAHKDFLKPGPALVSPDLRGVSFAVDAGEGLVGGKGTWPPPSSVELRVKAWPLLPPMPGVPINVGRALPPVEGRCVVDVDVPPDRIHVLPAVERMVLDSVSGQPQPLKLALQRFDPARGAYVSDFTVGPVVTPTFERGDDVVTDLGRAVPTGGGVTTFAPRVKRVLLGTGQPVTLFTASCGPPPSEAARFTRSGGQPRLVQYAATTTTPMARLTVWSPRGQRLRAVLGVRVVPVPAERVTVQVRRKAAGPAPQQAVYVDVEVISGPARLEESHFRSVGGVAVDAGLKTAPIDLRRQADSVCSDVDVTVDIDDGPTGPFLFSATKLGCTTLSPVHLGEHGLSDEVRARLCSQGGVLQIPIEVAIDLDGWPIREPVVEPSGSLSVDGESSIAGVWNAASRALVFTLGDGTTVQQSLGPFTLGVEPDLAARLVAVVDDAAAIDERLKGDARDFGAAVVALIAQTEAKPLETSLADLERRVTLTSSALRGARDLTSLADHALTVRESAIARQQANLVQGFIELASFSIQRASLWKGDGDAAKRAVVEGAEQGLKQLVSLSKDSVAAELLRARSILSGLQDKVAALTTAYTAHVETTNRAMADHFASPLASRGARRPALMTLLRDKTDQGATIAVVEAEADVMRAWIMIVTDLEQRVARFGGRGLSGEVLDREFGFIVDDLNVIAKPSIERLQARQLMLGESLNPNLLAAKRDLQTSVGVIDARLSEVTLARVKAAAAGSGESQSTRDALAVEDADLRGMRAAVSEQIGRVDAAITSAKVHVKDALMAEARELPLASVLANAVKDAKDVHAAATPPTRVHVGGDSFENQAWALLHTVLQGIGDAVAGVVDAICSVAPFAYLREVAAKAGAALLGEVNTVTRWLITFFENQNPALSALDGDRLVRGQAAVARDATLPEFVDVMRQQQLAQAKLMRDLDPALHCATFDRDGRAVVIDKITEPVRAELAERSSEQRRLLQAFAVATAHRMLDVEQVPLPLNATAAKGVADDLGAARQIATELARLERGLSGSNDDLISFGRTLGSDEASFADVDTAIDWLTYLLSLLLRSSAALGALTGVGLAGSGVALIAAEMVDLVGASLRVVVTSCLTIRRINGIPADLCMLTALIADGLVGPSR